MTVEPSCTSVSRPSSVRTSSPPTYTLTNGAIAVAAYEADCIWGVYQLLGKLCPTVYLWRRDA